MTTFTAPIRIALIGYGAIGCEIARAVDTGQGKVIGALVRSPRPPEAAIRSFLRVEDLISLAPDVVVECAGHGALRSFGPTVLAAGLKLIPASVGLFADEAVWEEFRKSAATGGGRILLPSGAVAGIDATFAAQHAGASSVRYRAVMPTDVWGDTARTGLSLAGEAPSETVFFRGKARDAARQFPKHANVTATISLAGVGFDRTEVELVADSQATENRHDIIAVGEFGRFQTSVKGRRISPHSSSSRLVAASLVAAALYGAPAIA